MFSFQMLYHHRGASVPHHFAFAKIATNTLFSFMHCKVLPHFRRFGSNLCHVVSKIQAVVAHTIARGRLAVGVRMKHGPVGAGFCKQHL